MRRAQEPEHRDRTSTREVVTSGHATRRPPYCTWEEIARRPTQTQDCVTLAVTFGLEAYNRLYERCLDHLAAEQWLPSMNDLIVDAIALYLQQTTISHETPIATKGVP